MKRLSVVMALTMLTVAAAPSFARPMRGLRKPSKIKRITRASEFRGRQTPKFRPSPIVIPPITDVGGSNLVAAKASINKAIVSVKGEIKDQRKVVSGHKARVANATKMMKKYQIAKGKLTSDKAAIQEELDVLNGISNPSSVIQTAISELTRDLASIKRQIFHTTKAIVEYKGRLALYNKMVNKAKGNLKQLKHSEALLGQAKRALGGIVLPQIKSTWKKAIKWFK